MKKIIIFSLLISSFAAVFNSCRKEDNAKLPDLIRAPLPLITKDRVVMMLFPVRNLEVLQESLW